MSADPWQALNELFHAAIKYSGDARRDFLAAACAGNVALLENVSRLLRAHDAAIGFMSVPVGDVAFPVSEEPEPSAAGTMVGPYRIVREIGRGGMGAVYLAERTDGQFHKHVAVKLIKRGMDTAAVLGRFRDERQILADLEHPNIARLLDAGTTDDGRPYFLMEYVDGLPIDRYCDDGRLTIEQRLHVFLDVCAGLSYAHQRLVVHRDIKPSNILVTPDGSPKLLDFGIAKVMHASSAGETLATAAMLRPMTPEYASPEQVSGLPSTTLGDVYSLGVLLYELLAGRAPFRFATRTPEEIARVIMTVDPQRPSETLQEDKGVARATTVGRLRSRLQGDLDTIVLKALHKDRERRYQSVEQLAGDIRRHLDGLPILARQDAALYRAVKFVRRHRRAVAAAALVFITLVIGIAATSWQTIRASRAEQAALLQRDRAAAAEGDARGERDRALRAEQEATSERVRAEQERNRAVEASQRADAQSATANAISDFLQNDLLAQASSLAQAGPTTRADPGLTVRAALDRAAERIDGKFGGQPALEASIRQTIGDTYRQLALYAEAQEQMEKALALRQRVLGETHADTLSSMRQLGALYSSQGKNGPAESLLTKVLEQQLRLIGENHRDTLETMNFLAQAISGQGRHGQAEVLFLRLLQAERRLRGEEHPDTLGVMNNLVSMYINQSQYARAEELGRKLVAIRRRVLGEEHPSTLMSMNNLGVIDRNLGKYAEAEMLLSASLDGRRRVFGADHPLTVTSITSLALVYQAQTKYAQAEPLLLQGLEARRRVLGEEHPQTAAIMNNLAELYRREGKQQDAANLFTQVFDLRRRILGPDHPNTLNALTSLAGIKLAQHQYADAEVLLRQALNGYEKSSADTWLRYYAQSMLGASLAGRGNHAEAEPLLRSGYQGMVQHQSSIPVENRSILDEVKGWIDLLPPRPPTPG
jgi:eukaryotic-like serine/threonine-protein kinase